MYCVTVATGNIVKIIEGIVEEARPRMNVNVVYVALTAIEENTTSVVYCFLKGVAGKTGPVSRNLASANNVGVVTNVGKYKAFSAFLVKSENVNSIVNITNGTNNVGVVNAGV